MQLPSMNPFLLLSLAAVVLPAGAEDVLRSSSLAACQENSEFTASLFDVVFTPNNLTASVNMIAISSIEGYVLFDITILAYGYEVIRTTVNPCNSNLPGLCPMRSGRMDHPFNLPVTRDAIAQIPGIAYTLPDLDATVRVYINMTSGDRAGESIACVEADISNGKTVDLIGVKWAAAAVAGLALISSAVVSGLGFSNAASHIAANTLSLFSYFQAQAILGLCSVPLPPVVQSWTQDFQWSMGIIRVPFIQDILTWYQRSTGGQASALLDTLHTVSVQVEKVKRALPAIEPAVGLAKRSNIQTSFGSYIVYGIQRVAFREGIETTNLFLTGLTFFYIFVVLTALAVLSFKGLCELAARAGLIKGDRFSEFRAGWLTVLKGILYRVVLIGFPQMTILCLWEFTQNDSAGAIVLAVFFFFGMLLTLSYAAYRVIRMARRSVSLHRNPAYILFSDPRALNKWGFLYVQFRASAYYFIVPVLAYVLVKGMFIAFAQRSGTAQAIALIIIEAAALIAASVLRPWMDKSTNSFNIAICAMNFVNAIFLFVFTDVFGLPRLVIGVVGVVLWIANAAFALILLLMLIITTGVVLFHNNPDTRYQFMNDDRTSFMKSQTHIATTSELDALAATARGDGTPYKPTLDLDDDESGMSNHANIAARPGTAGSTRYSARDSVRNSARNSVRSSFRAPAAPSVASYSSDIQHLRNKPSGSIRAPSPFAASGSSSNLSGHQSQHNKPQPGTR
ncbi:putative flavin carrier protein 3 [Madurella mycetomatis]|uniref:Putative flavin carrier protein 3 n=1 Tax=Madurella mycetomatis TaxID=100816 RepID=A0A175W072_9PEZI|nr:putative flavin carrier protein 3 [Madurella mycetomatis]KXX81020.1 putative flavin carrier protein 3 [Madurella mycetomatis]